MFLITPKLSLAFSTGQCSKEGYSVVTINGIFTDRTGATNNMTALQEKLGPSHKNQEINYQYLLNPSHIAGFGDIVASVAQGLFDQKSDYDLVEMENDASRKVTTQKLLLVAHSQGNFYANNLYDKLVDKVGGVPSSSIGMYSVATPSYRVAGNGKYLTSDTDKVIAKVVGQDLSLYIMPPNTHIDLKQSDGNGHSFSDVYLKYKGDIVVRDIQASLDNLKVNNTQDVNKLCIDPPKLTMVHKIQGVGLAVGDYIATGDKNGVVYAAKGSYVAGLAISNTIDYSILAVGNAAYKTGLAISNAVDRTTLAVANLSRSLFASVFWADQTNLNPNLAQNLLAKEPKASEDIPDVAPVKTVTYTEPTPEVLPEETFTIDTSLLKPSSTSIPIPNVINPSAPLRGGGGSRVSGDTVTVSDTNPLPPNPNPVIPPVNPVIPPVVILPPPVIPPVVGKQFNFDINNRIYYEGNFIICNIDNKTSNVNGNNVGLTNYLNSNGIQLEPNTNYRFILGDYVQDQKDCTEGTNINDHSNSFHFTSLLASSVVYDPNSITSIYSFNFESLTPHTVGIIKEPAYTITMVVPQGVDVTSLSPIINIAPNSSIIPANNIPQDFTNPVTYTVTAQDGGKQSYIVNIIRDGNKLNFDISNRIDFVGSFILCNTDQKISNVNGNNAGVSTSISSIGWNTPYMSGINSGMIPNVNYRFIFGGHVQGQDDCTYDTHVNNYSENFYYTSSSGDSIVYGTYIAPVPPPADITPPSIISYTLNGSTSDITTNPITNNVTIVLNASENVNWMSLKIENQNEIGKYKNLLSGLTCVDGTSTCNKVWDGTLAPSVGLLVNGPYRIKVHMKDLAGNKYDEYLPSVINVTQ